MQTSHKLANSERKQIIAAQCKASTKLVEVVFFTMGSLLFCGMCKVELFQLQIDFRKNFS